MAKMTVLEIVQDVLSDMGSDNVNSYNDTVESERVAAIVRSVYLELISNRDWPHLRSVFTLDDTTSDTPTKMSLPQDIKSIDTLNYDRSVTTKKEYKEVKYKDPVQFLAYINARNSEAANTVVVSDYGLVYMTFYTDKPPDYYTSFDEESVVFDSYDSSVGSSVVASRTQVIGYRMPVFTLADSFVPDLPSEAFSGFLAEVKSTAFARIKQMQEGKAEQQSVRQKTWLSQHARKTPGRILYPNYGR